MFLNVRYTENMKNVSAIFGSTSNRSTPASLAQCRPEMADLPGDGRERIAPEEQIRRLAATVVGAIINTSWLNICTPSANEATAKPPVPPGAASQTCYKH